MIEGRGGMLDPSDDAIVSTPITTPIVRYRWTV